MLSRMLIALSIAAFGAGAVLARPVTVYIGTQDDAIYAASLDDRAGTLSAVREAAKVERPTWIATDTARRILYAVSETGNYSSERGRVFSFRIAANGSALTPVANTDSGGGGPTYLSHDSRNGTLFVANFGDGAVASIPALADGRLSPPVSVQLDTGSGPHPKQKGPHAHATALDPSGRWLLVPDMGADRIFVYRFDPRTRALSPAPVPWHFTGPGTGPRHIVFARDGKHVFLTMEHSEEVRSFAWDARTGTLTQVQALAMDPPDYTGEKRAAEIALSPDGRFVYTSNRGRHLIQVYAASGGLLTPVQDIASRGDTPRSFGISPDGRWMVVGNQVSKTMVVFAIDRRSGRLTPVGEPLSVTFKPVAFAFVP